MPGGVGAMAAAAFFSLPVPARRAKRWNRAPGRVAVRAAAAGGLDHGRAQVPVAFAGGRLLPRAGGLVAAGRQPGPGGQPGGGGEPGHVAAGFGHDHRGGAPPGSRDGHPPGGQRLDRGSGSGHQRVQPGDLRGEMIVGAPGAAGTSARAPR